MRVVGVTTLAAAAVATADPLSYPTGSARSTHTKERLSHHEVVQRYQLKLGSWKAMSLKKKDEMTPHEAVKNLAHLMDNKEEIMSLLDNKDEPKALTPKQKLERVTNAVQSVNEMYLKLDKRRTITETGCIVDLEAMYKTDEQYRYEYWKAHEHQNRLNADNVELTKQVAKGQAELEDMEDQFKAEAVENKRMYNKQKEEDFDPTEADVKLYEFMAQSVDEECKDGTVKKMLLQDGNCAEPSVGGALLAIFSNPELKEKIEGLPANQREKFENEIESLGASSMDDGPDSFLQVATDPAGKKGKGEEDAMPVKDVSKSSWSKAPNCAQAEVKCDELKTIVGEELVCKRKLRDAQAARLEELEEEHQDDARGNAQALGVQQSKIDAQEKQKDNNGALMGTADELKKAVDKNLGAHIWGTIEREHECHDSLEEIYGNNYCSCGALREFMIGVAKKEYKGQGKLKSTDGAEIVDCKWPDVFTPDPNCMKDGKKVPCVEGDQLSYKKEDLPVRLWTRSAEAPDTFHPLAMKCPDESALQLKLVCNNFLCPIDCVMSEWNPPTHQAVCSNKCTRAFQGDAVKTFTRTVQLPEKYQGDPCGEPKKEETCIDNEHCPVDCVQRKVRTSECAEACNTNVRSERVTMFRQTRRRGMRLWNRTVTKYIAIHPRHGGKECAPEGKGLMSKTFDWGCYRANRRCRGSEVCLVDQRDILIAYECSAGMQDIFGESQCRGMIKLIRELLKKMYSDYFGVPGVRVALVKFGNGKAEGAQQKIADVQVVSGWTGNVNKLSAMLDHDDAVDDPKWHWGFPNYNQMLQKAVDMFQKSDDKERHARRKTLLVMTKGKKVECSQAQKLAVTLRKADVKIHVALFNHEYAAKPGKFAIAKEMTSYPADLHFTATKGLSWLHTGDWTMKMIPKLCPKARDGRYLTRFMNPRSWFRPVHMGRICQTWGTDLFSMKGGRFRGKIRSHMRHLGMCIRLAYLNRMKGALWRYRVIRVRRGRWRWTRKNISQCLVDMKMSKMQQVKDDGASNDATCGCIALDGQPCGAKNKRSQRKGWSQQLVDVARGAHWRTIHFRTILDGKAKYKHVAGQDGKFDINYKPGFSVTKR